MLNETNNICTIIMIHTLETTFTITILDNTLLLLLSF